MISEAVILSRMAEAMYVDRNTFVNLAHEYGCRFRFLGLVNMRCSALIFDDVVYVAICGSNDMQDWVQNLTADQVGHCLLKTHAGFASTSGWVEKMLTFSDVDDIVASRRLILGGHSSGGCVAQLVALNDRFRPERIYTFGSPRLFNPASAAAYSALPWETIRFVMDGDPIPRLPLRKFRKLFSGAQYAHASAALLLTEKGEVLAEQSQSTLFKLWRAVKGLFLTGLTVCAMAVNQVSAMARNHNISRYRKALQKVEARL